MGSTSDKDLDAILKEFSDTPEKQLAFLVLAEDSPFLNQEIGQSALASRILKNNSELAQN